MLHIVLLILKIIGIVLLCILGILLLSVFCVLFVPVRYQIEVTREEGEGKEPFIACARITWLLHLVNVLIRYPGEVIVRARLLLFTVFRIPKKEKQRKRSGNPARKKEKRGGKEKDSERETAGGEGETPVEEDRAGPPENAEEWSGQDADGAPRPKQPEEGSAQEEAQRQKPSEGAGFIEKIRAVFRWIRRLAAKIKEFFENIQYTIRKFCDKIKSVLDNIEYYRGVLESDTFKRSAALCRSELGSVLKRLKPDKFEADWIIGMEDPSATGEILALFGILYPLLGQHVRIVGDFASGRLRAEGWIYIRGRVRAITFLRAGIRIYFNRDIKTLIKQLKKEAA